MTNYIRCLVLIFGLGAISPLSAATIWSAQMSGANEVPPAVPSIASGFVQVSLSGNNLTVNETFSNLAAPANAAHIHCCAPLGTNVGVAILFPNFPSVISGSYNQTFDLTLASTYQAAFITGFGGGTVAGAEAAILAALDAGTAYANVHNTMFPGGEIRGQLAPVPEPSSAWLLILGLVPVLLWPQSKVRRLCGMR
jgi:hypothetical protein